MGELLSQKKLVYLSVCVGFFFSPALSVNAIKDVALLDVDLACCRHLLQKLHGKAGKKSRGGKIKKGCDMRFSVSSTVQQHRE